MGVLAGQGRRRRLVILGGGIVFIFTLLAVALRWGGTWRFERLETTGGVALGVLITDVVSIAIASISRGWMLFVSVFWIQYAAPSSCHAIVRIRSPA